MCKSVCCFKYLKCDGATDTEFLTESQRNKNENHRISSNYGIIQLLCGICVKSNQLNPTTVKFLNYFSNYINCFDFAIFTPNLKE